MLIKRANYFIFHHKIYIRAWERECWFVSWERYYKWEKNYFRGVFFKSPMWMSCLFWIFQVPYISIILYYLTIESKGFDFVSFVGIPLFFVVLFEFSWMSKKWKYFFPPKYSIHGVLKKEYNIG